MYGRDRYGKCTYPCVYRGTGGGEGVFTLIDDRLVCVVKPASPAGHSDSTAIWNK